MNEGKYISPMEPNWYLFFSMFVVELPPEPQSGNSQDFFWMELYNQRRWWLEIATIF